MPTRPTQLQQQLDDTTRLLERTRAEREQALAALTGDKKDLTQQLAKLNADHEAAAGKLTGATGTSHDNPWKGSKRRRNRLRPN